MKKIGNFQTESPDRLSEQLDRFQDAVDAETGSIRAGYIPQLSQRMFNSATLTTATLLPGQVALCDSNLGGIPVYLAASPALQPGWLAIVKRFAANTVTVTPSGNSAPGVARRINATTSKAYTAAGLYWIYFDGSDWWA